MWKALRARRRLFWIGIGLSAVMAVPGCDSTPFGGGRVIFEISLAEVSGNDQVVPAGGAASAPLVVRITDQHGTPHSGIVVDWKVTRGEGAVSPASSTSGSNGQVQAVYTSGDTPGEAEVTAAFSPSASGSNASKPVAPVTFRLTVGPAPGALDRTDD